MENRYESLDDELAQAERIYDELCQEKKYIEMECFLIGQALGLVENMISASFSAIDAATRQSNVGAPQAISALQSAVGRLNEAYRLMRADRSCPSITFRSASNTAHMIHYSPDMASQQKKMKNHSKKIREQYDAMGKHIAGLDKLESVDLSTYQNRAEGVQIKILMLAEAVDRYAKCLATAQELYAQAQEEAILRANQIPH